MRVKQTHPKIAFDFVDPAQEIGQSWAARRIDWLPRSRLGRPQIHPIISGVLADQINFAYAFGDQSLDLRQDRLRQTAPVFPAHLWDHAKTARMITALGDFYVSRVRRGKPKVRRIVIGNVTGPPGNEIKIDIFISDFFAEQFLDDSTELLYLIESDERIYFGKRFAQFARKTLRHAAAHN